MDAIRTFLERVKENKAKIAVVGDLMIDEYYHVDVSGISPEFPIARMVSGQDISDVKMLGGAGNVCNQFLFFDEYVSFFGFADKESESLLNVCNIGLGISLLEGDERVPVKKRFYNGQFPICRWDVEKRNCGIDIKDLWKRQKVIQANFKKYLSSFGSPSVIIFSDYDKGVFSDNSCNAQWWLDSVRSEESITIVDPKKGPLEKWHGCSVFKPNMKEAQDLSGLFRWEEQCDFFQSKLECQAVVITQGGEGVVGKVGPKLFQYSPIRKICPDSVIGAGDCFVAFLAMGLAHGMDIQDSVEVAYEAGAIYVQRKHNMSVSPYELLAHIDPEFAKFYVPSKNRDYKLVFTNGCFDILHEGHLSTLRKAKTFGDKLVVAVNSDNSVRSIKGPNRPIISCKERMKMLAGLECVDFVVEFDDETPYNIIREIQPDVLVKGSDWADNVVGSDIVSEVYTLPLIEGRSTSNIILKIKSEGNKNEMSNSA
jgi:D-beta-D-heptose 7-phosphate kinase/D-beta-D-heptose 1-phosphate adenosyltransferase